MGRRQFSYARSVNSATTPSPNPPRTPAEICRISHAQRLLVTTDDTILDIALAAGFQSLSRFNEAFKSICGCPPRDYRKQHLIE